MACPQEKLLARYSRWANDLIYAVIAQLPDDAARERRDMSFGSLLQTLGHNYAVAAIFQAHIQGRRHAFTERRIPEGMSFAQLRALQGDLDAWYVAWIDHTSDAALDEALRFEFVDGGQGVMTRREMFLHVVNHHTFHRGFLAEALRRMSVAVRSMDLSTYCCARGER